jgi:hypothetical protein
VYDRGSSGVPGERECKRKKDVGTRREKTGIGWKERKEGAECAMRERDRQTIEHTWNGREGEKATGRNIE